MIRGRPKLHLTSNIAVFGTKVQLAHVAQPSNLSIYM